MPSSYFPFFYSIQEKPGLSAHAKDPKVAANSLVSLLEQAESAVPAELRHVTPVRVGVMIPMICINGA